MSPDFYLAQLYSESALSKTAYSAMPDAPVRSPRARRLWTRRRDRAPVERTSAG
jgi:hypothetical protein